MRVSHIIAGTYVLLTVLSYGCGQEEHTISDSSLPPRPYFEVSPLSGQPETIFSFDASSCVSKSGTKLKFRWDWEDDGVWDTDFSTESLATHAYDTLGYKKIRLEVKDGIGSSATARKEVFITVASKEMILIPAGEFIMGSPEDIGNDDEHPQHKVYLDAFLIGKYEVTHRQFAEFLNAIGRNDDGAGNMLVDMHIAAIKFKGETYEVVKGWEDCPVVGVSWYSATAYAEWVDVFLQRLSGKRLRGAKMVANGPGGIYGKMENATHGNPDCMDLRQLAISL